MFKIISQTTCGNYFSIQNTETTMTKAFSKIITHEDGSTEINENLAQELAAFGIEQELINKIA